MQIVANEPLIKRNARIGQVASLIGLVVLGGGMYVSFRYPEQFLWSLAALLAGFTLSQVGIYFGNRWGRHPRPDELLNGALKGLDHNYTLYHYTTPTAHLLVGPAGVWVLAPRNQRGDIVFDKGRWKTRGGGFGAAYMRIFAQEGMGRPDLEIPVEIEAVQKHLVKKMGEEGTPAVSGVLVFTHEKANVVEAEEAPFQAVPAKKLKDYLRKAGKGKGLSVLKAKAIQDALVQA